MATITRYVNTGSTPGGDGTTNATSGATRAYASLNAAEAALQRVTSDVIEIICDGSTADTTATTFDGWTVSSPGYIIVKGASSHGGTWNTSKYRLEVAGTCILIREQYVRIEDLQIATNSSSTSQYVCVEYDSNLDSDSRGYVSKCIMKNITATTGKRYGVWLDSNNGKYYVSNNIFYDFTGNANSSAIRAALELTEAYIYHNTMCGNNAGLYCTAGVTLIRLINNLFQDNTDSIVNTSGTSFHTNSNYNVCDDNGTTTKLVPGANSVKSTEITFANEGSDDFHTSDTAAQVGNNLYSDANLPIVVDIDGGARPSSGSVYAGADESSGSTSDSYLPSTLTTTSTVEAPTISTQVNDSYLPSTLTTTSTVENPTVNLSSTVICDTLSSLTAIEAPTVVSQINVTTQLDVVTTTSTVEAPTISTQVNETVSLNTLTTTSIVESVSISSAINADFSHSTLTTTSTVEVPTISTQVNETVSLSTLTTTSTVEAPTVVSSINDSYLPSTLTTTSTVENPSVTSSCSVALSTLNLSSTLENSTIQLVSNSSLVVDELTITASVASVTITSVINDLHLADNLSTLSLVEVPSVYIVSNVVIYPDSLLTSSSIENVNVGEISDIQVNTTTVSALSSLDIPTVKIDCSFVVPTLQLDSTLNPLTTSISVDCLVVESSLTTEILSPNLHTGVTVGVDTLSSSVSLLTTDLSTSTTYDFDHLSLVSSINSPLFPVDLVGSTSVSLSSTSANLLKSIPFTGSSQLYITDSGILTKYTQLRANEIINIGLVGNLSGLFSLYSNGRIDISGASTLNILRALTGQLNVNLFIAGLLETFNSNEFDTKYFASNFMQTRFSVESKEKTIVFDVNRLITRFNVEEKT